MALSDSITRANSPQFYALKRWTGTATDWQFLQFLLEAAPCKVHIILFDDGSRFAKEPRSRNKPYPHSKRFGLINETPKPEGLGTGEF